MESELGFDSFDGLIPGADVAIPIQTYENSEGSDSTAMQLQGGTGIERRRDPCISNITESDSIVRELQIMGLYKKGPKFSQTKSRVLEVEKSVPSTIFERNELKRPNSNARDSLYKKIKSMRAGTLPPSQGKDEDHCDSSDDRADDDEYDDEEEEEQGEKEGCEKNGKSRRFCRLGKKVKAIDVVIEWILFTSAMVVLIASLYLGNLKVRVIWGLEIWKWCVLVAVFFCGRLVTKWALDTIVFLIESKYLFNERFVYFLHGIKGSVRVATWLALVLVAWVLLIERGNVKRSKETVKVLNHTTKAVVSFLIGAVMWMVKTLLVKFIAATFHVKTFFAKIREAISDEYVLWTLSVPRSLKLEGGGRGAKKSTQFCCLKLPKWLSFIQNKEGTHELEYQQRVVLEKTNHVHQEERITLKKLGKMKPGKVPASTMGQLIDRIKATKLSIVSSALHGNVSDGGEQKQITSIPEAEAAANLIFKNVRRRGRDYIKRSDLWAFMNKENVDCLFEWFQKVGEEEKITETSLSEWVVNIYKQREYLSHSLKDARTAIEELNRILSVAVLVLITIVALILMGFMTTKVLVFFSSQLLLVVFVFGNTCKTLFEAMIFVFVMHPFDVGDRCVVDGVQMIVEEMDILKTAFLRYDNELIYYPNAVLCTKAISNFNRSPEKMGDSVCFDIDVSTSIERIEALKAKIKEYIEKKSHHWHPDHNVHILEIENMNKMKMALCISHKINFQDHGQKMNRRTELMLALKNIFEEIGITYHLLPQELHISYINSASNAHSRSVF